MVDINPRSPEISVVVPVFRSENYLIACINSLLDQTFSDFEIILTDRGERDVNYAIMLRFAEKDERVRIVHLPCTGYGASCNRGIEAARGRWIAIVNGDDAVEKTMLAELHEAAVQHEADVVRTPYSIYFEKTNTRGALREDCSHRDVVAAKAPRDTFTIDACPALLSHHPSIWAGLYRADFLKANEICFREANGSGQVDQGFRFLTLMKAERLVWLDRCLYNHRASKVSVFMPPVSFDFAAAIDEWTVIHDHLRSVEESRRALLLAALLPEEEHCIFAMLKGCQPTPKQISSIQTFAAEHGAAAGVLAPYLRLLTTTDPSSAVVAPGRPKRWRRLRRLWTDVSRLFHCSASITDGAISVLLLTHSKKEALTFRVKLGQSFTLLFAIGRTAHRG